MSVAVARVLVSSGWATDAEAVRGAALRYPLLGLTLALVRRDYLMLAQSWARARADGTGRVGALWLLVSAIGVAWIPDD